MKIGDRVRIHRDKASYGGYHRDIIKWAKAGTIGRITEKHGDSWLIPEFVGPFDWSWNDEELELVKPKSVVIINKRGKTNNGR